ncbi:hypothetical protein ILYODFUR_033382 [Ilyodon furcidens]|uniref:Uncharacterized protein n=1 Tax=Ilyodon furcidens TaxID=33524 RepID=A0ABV0V882_9TELE
MILCFFNNTNDINIAEKNVTIFSYSYPSALSGTGSRGQQTQESRPDVPLPIKVMNRTGDKGQPCRSPTCTGYRSDLVPAMRTKLLLRSYRDRMAPSKGPPIPYSWSTPHRGPRETQSNAFSRSTKHLWTGWANSHEPSSTL